MARAISGVCVGQAQQTRARPRLIASGTRSRAMRPRHKRNITTEDNRQPMTQAAASPCAGASETRKQ